jgi:hypothetical protein
VAKPVGKLILRCYIEERIWTQRISKSFVASWSDWYNLAIPRMYASDSILPMSLLVQIYTDSFWNWTSNCVPNN